MRKTFLVLLLSYCSVFYSQNEKQARLDTLKTKLQRDSSYIYRWRVIRPFLRYSERNSIENPHPVNFYGPQIGIVVNEYHIFGTGIYLSSPRTRKFYDFNDKGKLSSEGIDMRYGTLFYEYILVQKRFYELHLPFETGYGYYHAAYKDSNDVIYRSVNDHLFLASAGVMGIFKPVRWIGFTGSVGYRKANDPVVNGFYYMIGVWLGIKNLTSDINYYLVKKKRYRKEVKDILKQ
jgi:hypothetical protein